MQLTWILVADKTSAPVFFTVATPAAALEEIDSLEHGGGRLHDRDLTTDLPSRIKASDGIGLAFLGVLRQQLPERLKKLVSFELDKSIATESAAEIRKHLPEFLPNL
ncbi:MAG: host attachment protein [Methylococcaceae bacterium]|nr:host attachment protein [Methylococcaceae bacterium]